MTHPQTNPVSRAGNLLGLSWHDSQFIPLLNPANVLDYFSERSNPFYDKTCNNEIIKMQRLNPSHLSNMEGIEYVLLHVQEPVLYVIRKQHRHTNGQVTPLNDYYIIAGVVYQAPDLGSIINSRLMTTINHLQSAFDECLSYTRYHPSKGYSWEFKDKDEDKSSKKREKAVDPSSMFQRQRVDVLLMELTKKFPHRTAQSDIPQKAVTTAVVEDAVKADGKENTVAKQDVNVNNAQVQNSQQATTQQRMKPPPEKKPRIN